MEQLVMIQNVGRLDSLLRIAIGAILVAAALVGAIGPWGWIGIVALATGLARRCPAYLPLGLSTCRVDRRGTSQRP